MQLADLVLEPSIYSRGNYFANQERRIGPNRNAASLFILTILTLSDAFVQAISEERDVCPRCRLSVDRPWDRMCID